MLASQRLGCYLCFLAIAALNAVLLLRSLDFDSMSIQLQQPCPPLPLPADNAANLQLIRRIMNSKKDANKDSIVQMWTMTSSQQQDFAKEAVRKINKKKIPGDIVECGVWMGGMTMLMVFENMKVDTTRHFWLFDTFDGLPEPDDEKDDPRAKQIYNDLQAGRKTPKIARSHEHGSMIDGKWNWGPLDVVKNNVLYTGYPPNNFHLVEGKVEDSIPVTTLPDKIAILRLDTDWYMSTKVELEYMYERLQSGGVLIIDDYCQWGGSKTAVHEFFKEVLKLDADKISKSEEGPCLVYWKP